MRGQALDDSSPDVGEKSCRIFVLGNLEAFAAHIFKAGSHSVYILVVYDDEAVMEVMVLNNLQHSVLGGVCLLVLPGNHLWAGSNYDYASSSLLMKLVINARASYSSSL